MKKNILLICCALLLALSMPLVYGICEEDAGYTTNGTDYLNINSSVRTIAMSAHERWHDWEFFTPRLNFSKNVGQALVGADTGKTTSLNWVTPFNFTATLVVKNGSTTLGAGNYTLATMGTGLWGLTWNNDIWNLTILDVTFNRTFVKNVDDLFTAPSSIYVGATFADFITTNSPTAWGDDKTFFVKQSSYGRYVNMTNWAVGWDYSTLTCTDYQCDEGANKTLWGVLITIFLIGIMVYLVYSVVQGGLDVKSVVVVIIVAVILLVSALIINSLITTVCAT